MNEINKTKDTLDTVTISADYFIRLVKGVKDGENHLRAFAIVSKECDELKAALNTANATNSAQAEQLRDSLNEIEAMKAKLEDAIAKCTTCSRDLDANDTIDELRKENERLKAKLEDVSRHEAIAISDSRLAAAERCIEEMWSKMQTFDIPDRQRLIELESIIRAYREKREAK